MINFKIIEKVLGSLLILEAFMMGVCWGIALYFGEEDTLAFVVAAIVSVMCGFLLKYFGRNARNKLSRRDAFLLVSLIWVVFSLFGTIPFLLSGYIHSFTDAFFESMSGFTTTGATLIDNVERLPHGLLFWRSLTQWVGGVGIVFTTIALIPSLAGGTGSIRVFRAEATGVVRSKLQPRLSTNVRWIWFIYLFISFASMGCYMLCGMDWYEAANYAMSAAATGGFAIHNAGLGFFHSSAVEYVTIVFCFISGVNFTLMYTSVAKRRPGQLLKDNEFRLYSGMVVTMTVAIMLMLLIHNHYDVERAFRSSLFQVVSMLTTTGLFNDNVAAWPRAAWLILGFCMLIGACSGSTSGGLKCVRGVMLWKIVRNELVQRLHPNAVLPVKVGGNNVPETQRVSLLAYVTAFFMLFGLMAFILLASGIDMGNSLTICLSCLSNVGASLNLNIGAAMSWSDLSLPIKWLCSFMMLVGRLEIFTVLIILTPSFWRRN